MDNQGFEAHYDWMDGLVVQVAGRKKWTVYDPPLATFPRPDHIKRPPKTFLEASDTEGAAEPQEFVLSAGDLAYIPRGVVHEATTNTSELSDIEEEGTPSIHITFGVETATHYSVEVIWSMLLSCTY